jgi:hypothetical protein
MHWDAHYRGYLITAERRDDDWHLDVHPTRAEFPIMCQHSFTVPLPTMQDALAEAKRRIDRLLAG